MAYNIVYLEDQAAGSVIHDFEQHNLEVHHCEPTTFKATIEDIDSTVPDLILMDFRLMEGGGDVNAPAFAQYYRSLAVDDSKKGLPIVLLSNDERIHGYYQDFTSHDLFDFSIKKSKLSGNLDKYTHLIKELIESYKKISDFQFEEGKQVELLEIPEILKEEIDPRIISTLHGNGFISNVYMVSAFILDNIVKPIGVLIGEDVLAARIGVSKGSDDWDALCEKLDDFKYKGIYSSSYKRWWADGVEYWWNNIIESKVRLRRLSSGDKLSILQEKHSDLSLDKVEGDSTSVTDKYWTICKKSLLAVDPSEAFEIKTELSPVPWLDAQYYSYESVRDHDLILELTDIEKLRFRTIARG